MGRDLIVFQGRKTGKCINLDRGHNLTTDEARRLQHFLLFLFFAPQVGEGVDDDTEDEVQYDDDDHEEEQQVVDDSGCKQWLLSKTQVFKSEMCENHWTHG